MKPRPHVGQLLLGYTCRSSEGGCGALAGEQCKTHQRGTPTQAHADRWNQWSQDGSPGAWWHADAAELSKGYVVPANKQEFLITRIERNMARIAADLAELRKIRSQPVVIDSYARMQAEIMDKVVKDHE